MFRSILAPLDGSRFAEHALPLAAAIARRAKANLQVAHKHIPPEPVHPDSVLAEDPRLAPQERNRERAYLEKIVRRLTASGVSTVSAKVLEGPTAETLAGHVEANGMDLVVMTTHGRGPLSRFWLGSVADALVRRLTVPILLIRPSEEEPSGAGEPLPRHILIPLDGSPLAEKILEPAIALGELAGAEYTLFHAVIPLPAMTPDATIFAASVLDLELTEKLAVESRTYLKGVAERLRARGLKVRERVVVQSSVAEAILAEAKQAGADAIALETHGRGGFARLLMGSVADKIVRASHTPVLVQSMTPTGGKP
jgi:nucleotide-binding universal stress UspA family protein